jgi:hypothetical protein
MYKNYKIVACTAAGRRRYMQYLVPFVLEAKTVDRYDIWVNTHNGADIEFFKQLQQHFPKINLIMQPEGWVKGNESINIFYKGCCEENAVYFKLDDDIVWMENDSIDKMVKFRIDNPEPFLVSPLVINNALSTYLLQVCNKIELNPYCMSSANSEVLWRSADFALRLHEWFLGKLRNKKVESLHVGKHAMGMCRFSINAILWFGKDMKKINGVVPGDDEEFLSCIYPTQTGAFNCWNGDTIMAHFAFFTQRAKLDEAHILEQYGEIVKQGWKNNNNSIGSTIQSITLDIDNNESKLIATPSPYKNYNIHKVPSINSKERPTIKHRVGVLLRSIVNPIYNQLKHVNADHGVTTKILN